MGIAIDVSLRRAILAAVATVVIALVSAPAGVSATRGGADGRIAFDRGGDIWAIDAPGSIPDPTRVQLTSGHDADAKPSWSPPIEFAQRPTLIAFQRTDSESGNTDIYSLDVDAGGAPVRLTDADAPDTAPAWAPDVLPGTPGEFDDPPPYPAIAFERVVGINRDIFVMNADGSGEINVTNTPAIDESNPDWAPGGVVWSESLGGPHLAFDTAERGIREVFVMPIAFSATAGFVTGPRRPVTTQQPSSSDPSWFAFTPPGDASPVGELTDQIAFSGPEDLVGVAQINIAEYARADPADPNVFNSTPPFSQPERIFTDVFTSGATSSTAPAWSPTGTRIAFVRDGEIYVIDPAADTDTATNVTQSPDVHEDHPDWEAPVARIDETFPRRPRGRRSRQRPARATSVVPTPQPQPPTPQPQPPTPQPQPSKPPPGQCTMKGTPQADLLRGTRRSDVICAGAGRDVISGLTGNDVLRGGPGDDIIFGLAGNDDLRGGPGNDRLLGGRGKDRLGGGAGNDRIFGGPGRDRIAGGLGRDTLTGPRGRDRVTSVERPRRA